MRLYAAECIADFALLEGDWCQLESLLAHEATRVRELATGRIHLITGLARYAKYHSRPIKPRPGLCPSFPDPEYAPAAFKRMAEDLIRITAQGRGSRETARLVLKDFARRLYRPREINLLRGWIEEAAARYRENPEPWRAFAFVVAFCKRRLQKKR